jgi:hypothetical protein
MLSTGMTEVHAQTSPTAESVKVSMPAGEAPNAVATPVTDNTNPNPTNSGATMETRPGAGGGVDLETIGASDYERLIENMSLDADDDEAPAAAAEPAPPAQPAPQPATTTPASGEVQPAAAGDDGDGLLAPGKIPERYKVPTGDDPLLFHTLRFVKESRLAGGKLSAGEAEVMAKKFLGLEPEAAPTSTAGNPPAGEAAQAAQPAVQPATAGGRLAALEQQLEEATSQFETAAQLLDSAGQAKAMREVNRLNREIAKATVEAQQAEAQAVVTQSEAQAAFERDWQASESTAHDLFAHVDAANPASAISQKAAEIQSRYAASSDPALQAVYSSPNSPLLYYNLAAKELGIVPGSTPAQPAPTSPQKSTPPSVQRQVPVGAALIASSGGTQQPAAPTGPNLNAVQTSYDYESLVAQLG